MSEGGEESKTIKAYRHQIDNGFPGPGMRYFYITTIDWKGHPILWKADIDDEFTEGWGDKFVWDDDPNGSSIKQEDVEPLLASADEIGYIDENHELVITKRWQVPVGYGYPGDGRMIATSWDWVGLGADNG